MFVKQIKILLFFVTHFVCCQEVSIYLVLKDQSNLAIIEKAEIRVVNSNCKVKEIIAESYFLVCSLPKGEHIVSITHPKYEELKIEIDISETSKKIDIGVLLMKPLLETVNTEFTLIDNLDELLSEDEDQLSQTLLSSGKDQFWNSVAFQWRGAFFRPRGLGSEENSILINGIKLNSFRNGRFTWGAISGLNAVMRSQETSLYIDANPYDFGGIQGVNAFQFEAHRFRKGNYLSFSNTNNSYQGRIIVNHNTGVTNKGWAFSGLISGSYAKEGYIDGSSFRHVGGLFSVYKKWNEKHQFNFTSFVTPNSRGRNTALTNEVIQLKGRKYNPFWGRQEGEIRNSRVRTISAPSVALSHFWQPSRNIDIQNTLFYQRSKIGSSRLDFNGKSLSSDGQTFIGTSQNPDPTYYQRLPSFYLQHGDEDFEKAFLAQQFFQNNGQLDWNGIYQRNNALPSAAFILYSDVNEDDLFAINSIGQLQLGDQVGVNYKLSYQNLKSENYAQLDDLLGGKGYLDIDAFETGDRAQNNINQPNRIVTEDDIFRYHYQLNAKRFTAFSQVNYTVNRWDVFGAIELQQFSTDRIGLFENGLFPKNESLGKSEVYSAFTAKVKGGLTYNINNKWYAQIRGLYGDSPPTLNKVFVNPRQNNQLVEGLQTMNQLSLDGSLRFQYGKWKARVSGYHIGQKDDTSVRFFFTERISGLGREDNSDFVQQVVSGINTRRQGVELGLNYEVTNTLKINTSASYGKHWYTGNGDLKFFSDDFEKRIDFGETRLKNYRLANGPQQAYGLGFSYRDPKFWWFETQLNFFDDIYISIAEFLRTDSFATDIDGQPLLSFNEDRARELLRQEQLPSYFLWNAIGGKSWKLDDYYLGFTLGIQNILDTFYRTGGFEQSRNGNFEVLNNDRNQQFPLFGNRYWLGRGTTYYLNMYVRF